MKFSKVNIEISNICNLQCSFCPEVIREKKMMSVSLFREVIRQVAPLTEQVALHLMGDPLVHPKLEDILEICAEFKTPVFFVTNGVLLREGRVGEKSKVDLLLHPIIRQVNFSLHSFPDNFPNEDPTPYLEKIIKFTERAFLERPDLYINYRLWNLQETRGQNSKNSEMLDKILAQFSNRSARVESKVVNDIDVTQQKSIKLKNRLYLHFDTEFTWPSLDLPVLGTQGTCYGLQSHFGVLADGTVVPCCLDKEASIPLGKITIDANERSEKIASIEDILNSPRARAILKGFRERKLVEDLCQRCQYIERFK